ncbi:tyrosine-type recombinase/integrase [Pseudomonas sp.]|uniref:tyrosine-type recombinase/integrase n=1 Tax=Pseudomonas sp. TaxID=306 RepID=UPI003FD6FBDE
MPKLTKSAIDNLKAPAAGDTSIWDSELEGFGVRVQSSGRKTYVVRYRLRTGARTQRKLTICRCGDMAPDKARDEARKIFARVATGEDPAAERKKSSKAPVTLEEMFRAYVADLKAKGKTSWTSTEGFLLRGGNSAADFFGRKRVPSDITTKEVMTYAASFHKRGKLSSADMARTLVSAAYSWAMKSSNDYTVETHDVWGVTVNPAACIAVDANAKNVRNRNLSGDDIFAVWNAAQAGNAGFTLETSSCLQLIILCGQRVLETLRAEGSEIDLENALWHMPKEKTKGRKNPHTVPLPRQAIPIFKALIDKHGMGPLFPGKARKHMSYGAVALSIRLWQRMPETKLENFQSRDLRRTWKSRTHDAGVDRPTRDLIQQHGRGDTSSKHYDRADYLPQERVAMELWSDWMDACLAGKPMAEFEPAFRMSIGQTIHTAPKLQQVA